MKSTKRAGVWMDYSIAYVMELRSDSVITTEVISDFTREAKQEAFTHGEDLMHKKEQQMVGGYLKKTGDLLAGYDEVILFGPGEAKSELFNLLTSNPQFERVKLTIQTTDKLTENQRKAYLKNYFLATHTTPSA